MIPFKSESWFYHLFFASRVGHFDPLDPFDPFVKPAHTMNDAEFASEFAARSKKYQTTSQTQLKSGPTEVEIATKAHVQATLKSKAEQERKAKAFAARSVAVQRMVDVSRVAESGVSALSSSGSVTVPDDVVDGELDSPLPHEFTVEFERAQVRTVSFQQYFPAIFGILMLFQSISACYVLKMGHKFRNIVCSLSACQPVSRQRRLRPGNT